MALILPGGAELGKGISGLDKHRVACRPLAGVTEGLRPLTWWQRLVRWAVESKRWFIEFWRWLLSPEVLRWILLVIQVLAALVGLIAAVLALLGWSRR
jgi:hypothetical protein